MGQKKKRALLQESGLHEIENKKRPRAMKTKRGGLRLSPKKKRRALKIGAVASALVLATVAVFAVGMFNKNIPSLEVDDDFVTVSYVIPNDGSTPADFSDKDSALENIGRINWRFKQQTNWYSEMHGTTSATVGITVNQSVNTYKQYSDGVLIMADITMSSMVNEARQFCYVGDDVLWRTPAGSKNSWATDYDSLVAMEWKTGDPYAHLSVHDFQYGYVQENGETVSSKGLPGTELSVYVINEATLMDASDVTDNGDGTFTQTYYLNPEGELAPIYYRYQMAFTGNLTALPSFYSIQLTYTFDSEWQILKSEISESCSAPMGIWADCVSNYTTVYEYDTYKAESSAYDDYFSYYADKPVFDAPVTNDPTALSCLSTAFGSVLTGETTFELALDLGGTPLNGRITVDLGNLAAMSVSAELGDISLWYTGDKAYLSYGNVKVSMSVEELAEIIKGLLPEGGGSFDLSSALDLDSLLGSLAEGTFEISEDKKSAELSSELPLFGLNIPVEFTFYFGDNGEITLGSVVAEIAVAEDFTVGAQLSFGNEPVKSLAEADKDKFAEILPYVNTVIDLLQSETLHAEIDYAGTDFKITGYADVSLGEFALSGELTLEADGAKKEVRFAYAEGEVLIDLDGIKLKADVESAVALISRYVTLPEAGAQIEVAELLENLFALKLSEKLALTEEDGVLTIAVKGTELLGAFGIDFELEDVKLGVNREESALKAEALGATVTVTEGEPFAVSAEGYTEIVKYAEYAANLLTSENLLADVNFDRDGIKVEGSVQINFGAAKVAGNLELTSGEAVKKIYFAYADGCVYLSVDGIKVKADMEAAAALLAQYIALPEGTGAELTIGEILGLDFSELLKIAECGEDKLAATLQVTELLNALGVNFDFGEAELTLAEGEIGLSGYGASVTVKAGDSFEADTVGYTEIVKYAEKLAALIEDKTVTAEVEVVYGELEIDGTVTVSAEDGWTVAGEFFVTYETVEKKVGAVYADGMLYLTVDGLKATLGTEEAAALVAGLVQLPEQDADGMEILKNVLALDFSEVIALTESEESLAVTLDLPALLKAFGVDTGTFEIEKTELTLGDTLTAEFEGGGIKANVSVEKGGEIIFDPSDYTADLTPVLKEVANVLEQQGISFDGEFTLTAGDTEIAVTLENGALSWKNGFDLYAELSLQTGDTQLNLAVSLTDAGISFAYGTVGVQLEYGDFASLEAGLIELYNRIAAVVNTAAPANRDLLPTDDEVSTLKGLVALFSADSLFEGFDYAELLASATLSNTPDGLLKLVIKGLSAVVTDGTGEGGLLSAELSYASGDLLVSGNLNTAAIGGEVPSMPQDVNYLGADEFLTIMDYAGAAVELLAEENLNLSLSGEIYAEDEEGTQSKQYGVSAEINYYSGGGAPVTVDTEEKTITVNAQLYLKASVALTAAAEDGTDIYLELLLFDENSDGMLDCYVSLSKRAETDESRNPILLYAPASEIMTLLSGACAAMGVDNALLNDYVISKWLNVTEVAQLKALGDSVKVMIEEIASGNAQTNWQIGAGLIGGILGTDSSQENDAAAATAKYFISALSVSDSELSVSLDAEALFGTEGTFDISLKKDENGKLTAIGFVNLADGEQLTNMSLSIDRNTVQTGASVSGSYLDLSGFGSLLKTVGRSVTSEQETVISGEETQTEYLLNRNFYIDGNIVLDMTALGIDVEVNIRMVAFSITVDEDHTIGVNVRFEYDALKKLGITVINGNTTVDLTGKNGMVYIKRTQTTDVDGKTLAGGGEVVYRAMPLSNMVSDIFNQIGFLFNMNESIVDLLANITFETPQIEGYDLGDTMSNVLTSYTYDPASENAGDKWTFVLNGNVLSSGVLGDIVISLGADVNGDLRDLCFDTSMSMTAISMTVDMNLTYHNPRGVMDEGETDVTQDIAEELSGAMNTKLAEMNELGWTKTDGSAAYLEAELTEIKFVLGGTEIAESKYLAVATGADGCGEQGEVYGKLVLPDIGEIEKEYGITGYELVWDYDEDDPVPANGEVRAIYQARTYLLVFESEYELEGGVYDEANGVWRYEAEYRYGSDFTLPFAENETRRIVSFLGEDGREYTTLDGWDTEGTVFTAVWENIVYTVTFVIGDETVIRTGYYGDDVEYPDSVPDGYELNGWSSEITAFTCDITVTAELTPKHFTVTLVSGIAAEGFAESADGSYLCSIDYVYGTKVTLPTCDNEEAGKSLVGYTDGEGQTVYTVENILSDVTYTAVWDEIGYKITFVGEGGDAVAVLNGYIDDAISTRGDLPDVPEKEGYTGAWDFGGDTVTGNMTIQPVYTGIEYTVTLYSEQEIDGFELLGGVYMKQLGYVYGSAETALPAGVSNDDYDFEGYYSADGEQVEALSDEVIANIFLFGEKEGALYANWRSNIVTVTFASDIAFGGATFYPDLNAYCKTVLFNKSGYSLYDGEGEIAEYFPTVAGYQQLGWWHEEDGGWSNVGDVSALDGEILWAVWIQEIQISIDAFDPNLTNLGITSTVTYTIRGSFTGGMPASGKSSEIFRDSPTKEVQYVVYRNNTRDTLSGGDELAVEGNTFGKEKMTCGNSGSTWNSAPYGGAQVTHTFSYTGADGNTYTVSTKDEVCISLETYHVNFYNEDGSLYQTVDVRGVYGSAITVAMIMPSVPVTKEGYKTVWADAETTVIDSGARTGVTASGTNNIVTEYTVDVYLKSVPEIYGVTFVSDTEVMGWSETNGEWRYETEMEYGAVINYYVLGEIIGSDTVGIEGNVFTLPSWQWNEGKWSATVESSGATISAEFKAIVSYSSEVAFEWEGVSTNSVTVEVENSSGYELITPSASGYIFLGWWTQENDVWAQVTELGGNLNASLCALWASEVKVEISASKSGTKHTATANVSGGELIGAFAQEQETTGTLTLRYYANNDTKYDDSTDHGNQTLDDYSGSSITSEAFSYTSSWTSTKQYAHIVATLTYSYNGTTITVVSGSDGHFYQKF